MNITSKTKICMVIGDPVDHSLSPKMHNGAYQAMKMDNRFVFVAAHVESEDLEKAIHGIRAMNILGVAVTLPHKVNVLKYLDEIDLNAKKIGAVNTIVNKDGRLNGFNTDYIGAIKALEDKVRIKNKKIGVIGAGGAARAVVYGLIQKGAIVTIFNRSKQNGQNLSEEFICKFENLENAKKLSGMDILINTTSVGMDIAQSPINADCISKNQIVFDIVYAPYKTKLLRAAERKGAETIPGIEMLLHQGALQFELFTDEEAPVEIMRKIIMKEVKL